MNEPEANEYRLCKFAFKKEVKLHSVYTNHQVLWGRFIQCTHTNIRHPSTLTAPSQPIHWWTAQSSSPCQEEPIREGTSWNVRNCGRVIESLPDVTRVYIYIYMFVVYVYTYPDIIHISYYTCTKKVPQNCQPSTRSFWTISTSFTSPSVGRSTYLDPMQPDTTRQATTSQEQKHQQSESWIKAT